MNNTTPLKPSKTEALKEFWNRKKGVLAVTATATTIGLVMIMRGSNKTLSAFLKENGLEEEYWRFIGADEEEIAEMFKK